MVALVPEGASWLREGTGVSSLGELTRLVVCLLCHQEPVLWVVLTCVFAYHPPCSEPTLLYP